MTIKQIEKKLGVDIETFYNAMLYDHYEFEFDKNGKHYLVGYGYFISEWDGRLDMGTTIYVQDGMKRIDLNPALKTPYLDTPNYKEIFHATGKYVKVSYEYAEKDLEFALRIRKEYEK